MNIQVLVTQRTSESGCNVAFESCWKEYTMMTQGEITVAGITNRETVVRRVVMEVGFDSLVDYLKLLDFFESERIDAHAYTLTATFADTQLHTTTDVTEKYKIYDDINVNDIMVKAAHDDVTSESEVPNECFPSDTKRKIDDEINVKAIMVKETHDGVTGKITVTGNIDYSTMTDLGLEPFDKNQLNYSTKATDENVAIENTENETTIVIGKETMIGDQNNNDMRADAAAAVTATDRNNFAFDMYLNDTGHEWVPVKIRFPDTKIRFDTCSAFLAPRLCGMVRGHQSHWRQLQRSHWRYVRKDDIRENMGRQDDHSRDLSEAHDGNREKTDRSKDKNPDGRPASRGQRKSP